MHYLLLNLAAFTVGAHSLVVGSVLLTVPLNLDGSYVDGGSFVVFIIDTTHSAIIQCGVQARWGRLDLSGYGFSDEQPAYDEQGDRY